MSKLEELIAELCPDGVEFVNFGEVVKISKGVQFNKKDMSETGSYPVINGGINPSGYIENYNFESGKITISQGGASAGYVNWLNCRFWAGAHCYVLEPIESVLNRYVYHFIKGKECVLQQCQYGAGIPALSKKDIADIKLPVPPLEVQREIVRILDDFTLYQNELAAELAARKKQYEYYHNSLMDFSGREIIYKSVGELFEIKNGLNKEKSAFGKGKPIINFTDVYNKRYLAKDSFKGLVEVDEEEIERYSAKKGDVFFTRTSETKEDIGMSSTLIEDIPDCVFSGFVLRARPKTSLLLPKFCSYYFSTDKVRNTIVRYAAFTTRATTTGPKLSKIMVPILSLSEQQRIVDILDRFDTLCNDISKGLPAEIEARRKQYEYFRDKLLTFKAKEA